MQFYEWLIFNEAITRAVLRVFGEVHSFDPAEQAAAEQTNKQLQGILGHPIDFFAICLMHARKYPDIRNDAFSLATHVANTIMMELNDSNGELAQRFAEAEDESAVTRLFHTAASLRTRREGPEFTGYRRGAATSVPISSLQGGGEENGDQDALFGSYEDESSQSYNAERLTKLKNALIHELQNMLDAATHQRTKDRLVNAILVARERFRNAESGERVPMGELQKIFSKEGPMNPISKGGLVNILREIETAFAEMAKKLDDETLIQGAKEGGSWKASRKKRTG